MSTPRRKPNLFVIGAMKSGTTSLHEYLDTHPQISMSTQKEPAFFAKEFTLNRGEDWYLSLFSQDSQYKYLGESSTQYTRLPLFEGVPQRLYEFNPNARLIYIMRNPLERVISHYWHATRVRSILKGAGEPRPLVKAILESPDEYLATGNYAMQLEPYIALFGLASIYTLTFEALIQNPQQQMNKIYQWLGLSHHPLGQQLAVVHNQAPKDMESASGAGILYRIRFSNAWHVLSPYFPDGIKRFAKTLAYRSHDKRRIMAERSALEQAIGGTQCQQIELLSSILGHDFPEWRQPPSDAHNGRLNAE